MKHLSTLLYAIAAACVFMMGYNAAGIVKHHNLATDVVLTVEPDAQCTSMYNGEGPALTYSARCKLPNKAVLMCSVDTSSAAGKEKGLACVTVLAPPQPPAPPQAAAAPPAPVAPPVAPAVPAPEGK